MSEVPPDMYEVPEDSGGYSSSYGGGSDPLLPPHNDEAERSVLGGMMVSKDAIGDAISQVRADDFYEPKHQTIFNAITDLYSRGQPADFITIANALEKTGDLGTIGGANYLHTLSASVPTAAATEFYAKIVREKAIMRSLVDAGTRITQMGYSTDADATDMVNRAQSEVFSLGESRTAEDYVRIKDIMPAVVDEIELASESDNDMTGVPTGFRELDSLTGGLHGGQMIIVAARPAIGKSTLSMDFCRAAAIRNGKTAVIFSLEMSRSEMVMRMLSAESGVDLQDLRKGRMEEAAWTALARTMSRITDAPIFIDDSPNMSLMEIRSKCRRLKQQHNLELVVVDYLQLLSSGKRVESRQQEVSEFSRALKLLAKEIDVPVVAVAQLNRGPEQRTDKKPMMSDLRESGSLEQDADVVMLLHREDVYDKDSPRVGEADIIVAKHRNGPTGVIAVAFQGHLARFAEMAQEFS